LDNVFHGVVFVLWMALYFPWLVVAVGSSGSIFLNTVSYLLCHLGFTVMSFTRAWYNSLRNAFAYDGVASITTCLFCILLDYNHMASITLSWTLHYSESSPKSLIQNTKTQRFHYFTIQHHPSHLVHSNWEIKQSFHCSMPTYFQEHKGHVNRALWSLIIAFGESYKSSVMGNFNSIRAFPSKLSIFV
jgi:hypothetical protein